MDNASIVQYHVSSVSTINENVVRTLRTFERKTEGPCPDNLGERTESPGDTEDHGVVLRHASVFVQGPSGSGNANLELGDTVVVEHTARRSIDVGVRVFGL